MKASRFNVYATRGSAGIVANLYSSAAIKVDTSVVEVLQNNVPAELSAFFSNKKEVLDLLQAKDMLLADEVDEDERLAGSVQAMRVSREKLNYTIAITMACNFACPYCYQERESQPMDKRVQDATIAYIASQIDETTKKLSICWYGGEPTLAPHIMYDMSEKLMRLAEEHGITYEADIITNGYLLNEEMLKQLKKYAVKKMQITIDGSKETHDRRRYLVGKKPTYDTIMRNIALASKMGFSVRVRMNVNKENAHEFEDVKKEIGNLDGVTCYAEILFDASPQQEKEKATHYSNDNAYDQLRQQNEDTLSLAQMMESKRMCGAVCVTGKTIHPKGLIFDCTSDISEPEKSSGTVFDQVSQNEENAQAPLYDISHMWKNEECKQCAYLPACFGGCPKHYQEEGLLLCTRIKDSLPRKLDETLKEMEA